MARSDALLTEIAAGLLRLRRLWGRPDVVRQIRAPGGKPLQLSNLMVVHAVAALREGATVGAVAEQLDVDPSTASRLVGHATDAGLVTRQPSPADARRADLRLTAAGRRVRDQAERSRRAFVDELMAGWTEQEREVFASLLTRLTDAAARIPPDPERVSKIFRAAEAADRPS